MGNELQQQAKQTALTIKQQGKTFLLTDSRINSEIFGGLNGRIVKARTSGYALDDLTDKEFDFALSGIIFNVSVLCGCQLPTNDAHVNALEHEFSVFLKEYGFGGLTTEEILTAFRMNSAGLLPDKVEIYGALFNIDYAAKVLNQYLEKRNYLDRKIADGLIQIEYDEQMAADDLRRRSKIKSEFEKYLSDPEAELDLKDSYMQLLHDGAFADNNFYFRFTSKSGTLVGLRGKYVGSLEYVRNIDELMNITFEAQRLAVLYLFKQMVRAGKTVLYNDSWKLEYPNFAVSGNHLLISENESK